MGDIFKKFLHTGVGFVSIAVDKFKNAIDDLVKEGKLSEEEGKKIVDDFVNQSDDRKKEFEKDFGNAIKNIVENFKFLKKEEFDLLEKRVEILEKLVAEKENTQKIEEKKEEKKKEQKPDNDENKTE